MFTYVDQMFTRAFLPMFTDVYSCYLCLSKFTRAYLCLPMFNLVYLWLPMFTIIYSCFFIYYNQCFSVLCNLFTHVCGCLPMFTRVYPCLLVLTYFYTCLTIFTYVYSCLPMFNTVYLSIYTYSYHVYSC